jgi:hypothetical protein
MVLPQGKVRGELRETELGMDTSRLFYFEGFYKKCESRAN